jgi:Domain of unknown function (DUF4337)
VSDILEVHEQHERASEAHHGKDAFASRVSILVAVLAVATAATSSLENTETARAITDSSRAVLAQDKATDQWNFFESKSLKKNILDIAAAAGGSKAADYAKRSVHEGADEGAALEQAKEFEHKRDEAIESSEKHEHRHHRLAIAATLLEIGIAISTIAIITRKHWPWAMSAILGTTGVLVAASAFL